MAHFQWNAWLKLAVFAGGALLALPGAPASQAQQTSDHMHVSDAPPSSAVEPKEVQIARAMSAAPADIARSATIIGRDEQGKPVVFQKGTNGFTCRPGNLSVVGDPPQCANQAAEQWYKDIAQHKPVPTNTEPGIVYMLAGATQHSVSDPNDHTSPPIKIGPHWMILWPFDPKTTGLPVTNVGTGAYIMWAGTPYAHLHINGNPEVGK
jgi:hypothetical protein